MLDTLVLDTNKMRATRMATEPINLETGSLRLKGCDLATLPHDVGSTVGSTAAQLIAQQACWLNRSSQS